MMRNRRWLRILIAASLAIVLGITGAVIGRMLASPVPSVAAAQVETVPVIAPVAIGEDVPQFDPDVEGAVLASPIVGEIDVPVEGTGELVTPDSALMAALGEIGTAEDPAGAASEVLALYERGSADDPCAGDGTPPAGCPAGLEGTVLALSAPPPFEIRGVQASPPTTAAGELPACAAASLSPDEVQLGVSTNAPAHVSVTLTIGGRPAVTEFDTPAYAAQSWQEALAAATSFTGDWTTVRTCGVISGLERGVEYSAQVVATNSSGVSVSRTVALRSDGQRTAPQPQVFALTDDYLVATAPHRATDVVSLLAYRVTTPFVECPTGAPNGDYTLLRELGTWRSTLTASWLNARNYDLGFTKNTTIAYAAPAGSTLLFCIRVESGASVKSYSSVVQTADRATPSLQLYSVDFRRQVDAGALTISAANENGQPCGRWTGPATQTNEPQLISGTVCSPTQSSALQTGITSSGYDSGIPTRMVLTASVETPFGPEVRRQAIDVSAGVVCSGSVCVLPPPRWYYLSLPFVPIAIDTPCWSNGCAPSREGWTGTARLLLTWTKPAGTGMSRTVVGQVVEQSQLDTDLAPRFDTEGARLTALAYDTATRSAQAGLTIAADKTSQYSVRLTAAPGYQACSRPGAVLERTGTVGPTPIPLTFEGLCAGAGYVATVELTDAAGNRSTWGPPSTLYPWVTGRFIQMPSDRVDLHWEFLYRSPIEELGLVTNLQFSVSGYLLAEPRSFCAAAASDSGVVRNAQVDELTTVRLSARVQVAPYDAVDETCRPLDPLILAQSVNYPLSIDRLLAPDGITITTRTADDEKGNVTLHVWATRQE